MEPQSFWPKGINTDRPVRSPLSFIALAEAEWEAESHGELSLTIKDISTSAEYSREIFALHLKSGKTFKLFEISQASKKEPYPATIGNDFFATDELETPFQFRTELTKAFNRGEVKSGIFNLLIDAIDDQAS